MGVVSSVLLSVFNYKLGEGEKEDLPVLFRMES